MHAIKKVENEMSANATFKHHINELIKNIREG